MDLFPPSSAVVDKTIRKASEIAIASLRKAEIHQADFNLRFNPPQSSQPSQGLLTPASIPTLRIDWVPCSITNRLAPYLVWLPQGLPDFHWVTVACSRMPRKELDQSTLGIAVRTLVERLPTGQAILTGAGTTLDVPVRRACEWYRRWSAQILPLPKRPSATWFKRTYHACLSANAIPVYARRIDHFNETKSKKSFIDELLFQHADEIRVLFLRPQGNIERLLNQTLTNTATSPRRSIYLLTSHSLTSQTRPPSAEQVRLWQTQGVVSWHLNVKSTDSASSSSPDWHVSQFPTSSTQIPRNENSNPHADQAKIIPLSQFDETDFFCHCTRATSVWPDQTEAESWDSFLLGQPSTAPAWLTLCRILCQQKLLASGHLIADGQRVVCFTEIPLSKLSEQRRFRPHLGRWDFEPYGIALAGSRLRQHPSFRAVTYGNDEQQAACVPAERVYFQRVKTNQHHKAWDWSQEREWRVIGDLDLRTFATQEIVAFIPTRHQAKMLQPYSRWPVVYLEKD